MGLNPVVLHPISRNIPTVVRAFKSGHFGDCGCCQDFAVHMSGAERSQDMSLAVHPLYFITIESVFESYPPLLRV